MADFKPAPPGDDHHRSPGFKTPAYLQVAQVRLESMRPRQLHSKAAGLTRAAKPKRRRPPQYGYTQDSMRGY